MRMLAIVGVLAGCGAPPAPREKPVREHRDPPCLPFTERSVRARTDGAAVVFEQITAGRSCHGDGPQTVTPLARIEVPPAAGACPIGQLVLRMWDRGHGSEDKLPAFVAALASEDRAELRQAMMYFADSAEAYVIDCPKPGRADYLLVEPMPRNERARIELFIANKLVERRAHPRVTFVTPAY